MYDSSVYLPQGKNMLQGPLYCLVCMCLLFNLQNSWPIYTLLCHWTCHHMSHCFINF